MTLFASFVENPQMLVAAGLGLAAWLLLRKSFQRRPSFPTKSKDQERRDANTRKLGLVDAPREYVQWEVSMYETARDLKAELDTKMMALQALVRMAQEETARLQAAIRRAEQLGIATTVDPLTACEQWGEGLTAPLPEVPAPQSVPAADRILQLANDGLLPQQIADRLQIPLGDVEITLSLRPAT